MTTPRIFGHASSAEQVVAAINLSGKVAVVTGGNSGIGQETCRVLCRAGAHVVLCARNVVLGQEAIDVVLKEQPGASIELLALDLADLKQVQNATEKLLSSGSVQRVGIHMLICNAGVMALPKLQRTAQGFEMQSGTNWLGHMHFVNGLLPLMKAQATPSRIVLVASLAHKMGGFDIKDLNWETRKYSQWGAYGQSKTANMLHARWLAKMLQGTPVRVFALHPGNIPTNLARHLGGWAMRAFYALGPYLPKPLKTKTIPQGAATQVYAATAPELEQYTSGEYLDDCAIAKTTPQACDLLLAEQLWQAGERYITLGLEEGSVLAKPDTAATSSAGK